MHGPAQGGRRKKKTQYRMLLEEKQKVRFNYGVSERQLRRYVERARRSSEPTGEALLMLLESRLDNVVYRLGFAPTIPAARQLVAHGHIRLNARKVDRPAHQVVPGDEISLSETGRQIPYVAQLLHSGPAYPVPGHLLVDAPSATGRMVSAPPRDSVSVVVREAAIVEFYAR